MAPQESCDNECVDLSTDTDNCGSCGNKVSRQSGFLFPLTDPFSVLRAHHVLGANVNVPTLKASAPTNV